MCYTPHIYLYLLLSALAIRIHFHRSFMFGCVCVAHVLWMKWFVFPITSSRPSHRCDFLINTFPLAFVCLALFFLLRRRCSRSSFLLPLLRVLSLSLLFSHFLLFLFSRCQPVLRWQTPLAFGGQRSAARERFASKTAGERPLLTTTKKKKKPLLGILKSTAAWWRRSARDKWRDERKRGPAADTCPHYAKVKDVWQKPAVNIFITLYCGS